MTDPNIHSLLPTFRFCNITHHVELDLTDKCWLTSAQTYAEPELISEGTSSNGEAVNILKQQLDASRAELALARQQGLVHHHCHCRTFSFLVRVAGSEFMMA